MATAEITAKQICPLCGSELERRPEKDSNFYKRYFCVFCKVSFTQDKTTGAMEKKII